MNNRTKKDYKLELVLIGIYAILFLIITYCYS